MKLISFKETLGFIEEIQPLSQERIPASEALSRVLSRPVISRVNAPAVTSSLKDGYALISDDVKHASPDRPVRLQIRGTAVAGHESDLEIHGGEAVKIMTGAPIPQGATAVLPQELTAGEENGRIAALASSEKGRNILRRGADIAQGELLLKAGTVVNPAVCGLISASGNQHVWSYRLPRVSVLATGSELQEEGTGSMQGKIFPSNRATIAAWLQSFGIACTTALCRDDARDLEHLLGSAMDTSDVIITSGGVLDGEKDLVISVMEGLGVKFLFKRCRIGPGKGICMGTRDGRFFFNLPGGPPSNYVAFLLIALPAVLRLMGRTDPFPPAARATILADLKGRADWTQIILARTSRQGMAMIAAPVLETSRLKRICFADSLIVLPEGVSRIARGDTAETRLLFPCF